MAEPNGEGSSMQEAFKVGDNVSTSTPDSLRDLTEEEVVAAARAFWLDEHCERVDEDDEPALPYEV